MAEAEAKLRNLQDLCDEYYEHKAFVDNPSNPLTLGALKYRVAIIKQIIPQIKTLYNELKWEATDKQEFYDTKYKGFHTTYIEFVGKLDETIERGQQTAVVPSAQPTPKPSIKFPVISLPEFDGSLEKWLPFRDIFESMVHRNTSLDKMQKYHYLRTSMKSLQGAANILNAFALSEDLYDKAWDAVKDRYNDERKLKAQHITTLLTIKKMTNESPAELRRILDAFSSTITTLEQLSTTYDDILVHVVQHRMDEQTLKDWQKNLDQEEPSWNLLKEFLKLQWRQLDQIPVQKKSFSKPYDSKPSSASAKSFTSSNSSPIICTCCKQEHKLHECSRFKSMTNMERFEFVKASKLCRNCLSPAHQVVQCKSNYRCRMCKKNHHSMIHLDNFKQSSAQPANGQSNHDGAGRQHNPLQPSAQTFQPQAQPNVKFSSNTSSMVSSKSFAVSRQALLSTVRIQVRDANGDFQSCRALLDQGSEDHYITEKFAHRLNLPLNDAFITIVGINGKTSYVKHTTTAHVISNYQEYEPLVEPCLVVPNITGILPGRMIDVSKLSIPEEYFLADPEFNKPAGVDMLIGSDVYYDCELAEKTKLPEGPYMKHTKFGWVFGGKIQSSSPATSFLSCFTQRCNVGVEEIDEKLEKFMEIENVGTTTKLLSHEEQFCEDLYKKTTKRDSSGRYVVQLPFKANIDKLGNNRSNAFRQFHQQESRRLKDEELNEMYVEYIDNYISTNDMTEIDSALQDEGFFLPHHGVKKMTSTTTKVRPVFNGSSKSETSLSLNDCLCVGPTVQPDSFDIFIRFRERPFVLKSDIEKMYRQVLIDPSQRKYQKIFWRKQLEDLIKQYELNTVTFGLGCAAYLATRTLIQIADDYEEKFPEAARIIKDSFYVDDLMFGCHSIEEALKMRDQIRFILAQSHMPARKWASNDKRLLAGLLPKDLELTDDDDASIKTLGHNWFPSTDQLSFNFKKMTAETPTKASVLSEIASIYDPLGIIGPVILKAKLFMKVLWERKLKWSDELPADVQKEWNEFRSCFESLNDIFIDRYAVIDNPVRIELHGFGDASDSGYAACVYVRAIDSIGNIQVTLICSKSRVSPPKKKSTARLELCAGLLLSKLMTRITKITSLEPSEVTLWSDSMIVLYWILTPSSKLSIFVGNRVAVIQELTPRFIWKHIRGEINPADVISRGLMPYEIRYCNMWWDGPPFFSLPNNEWPESLITINDDDPEYNSELRKSMVTVKTAESWFTYIERFSRVNILINAVARLKRLARNYKKDAIRMTGPLTIDEREDSTKFIIRIVQQTMFEKEYQHLLRIAEDPNLKEDFPSKSLLLSLAPIMDKDEKIIRVGGRVQASPGLTDNQKHPIVLPNGNFAKIVIRDLHQKNLHPGALALLAQVRENYWPLQAKRIIRKVQHQCITCFKAKPPVDTQFMGSLPEARVKMQPPFTSTAVDYTGYFNIRASITKKATIVKAYVAMFKCMSTGAIHLEAVSALSTDAFIAAFDRFISRRGLSVEIFSDNGTNFQGANNEFKKILKEVEPHIAEHLKTKSIQWHFTTPLAPHAGGYYESGIKTMKHHLTRVMDDGSFDFEQFSTILCKIEAIINSRPLTPMSEDPNDLRVLTPAHFLVGRSLLTKPERNFVNVQQNRVDKWNRLQQIQQKFWDAWYHDYLHNLQERPKDFREKHEYSIGDMVIIKDCNLPPLKWITGRISHLFPAKDGVVRRVRVRTMKGGNEHLYDRHVKYLVLLPFE